MSAFPLTESMLMVPRHAPKSAWLGHVPFASWLVGVLRPQSIVELGTHRGASFLAFCQAVDEQFQASRVFAIDSWEGDEHAGFYGEEIYMELRDYQQRNFAAISELMRMRFEEALGYFADGSIDLLHIDGLHTYEAVSTDFHSWLPKLSGRAVVLFHDICVRDREFGVWKFWDEVSQRYPSFSFSHTHGLGVLLVGDNRQPALEDLAVRAADGSFSVVNQVFDVLGRNIKNVEEIERVNAGLTAAHAELARVSKEERDAKAALQAALGELAGSRKMAEHKVQEVLAYLQELNGHATRVAADGVARMIATVDENGHRALEVVTAIGQHQQELDRRLEDLVVRQREAEARQEEHNLRQEEHSLRQGQWNARQDERAEHQQQWNIEQQEEERRRAEVAAQSKQGIEELASSLHSAGEKLDSLMRPWWRRRTRT